MFKSKNDYNKTPTINIKNTKVSMLSYTFGTNNLTPKSPYQIKYINKQQIKRDIKKQNNIVILLSFLCIGVRKATTSQVKTKGIC